jgi:hypothetical protein
VESTETLNTTAANAATANTDEVARAPRKHLGAHSELVACAFLLREGYEVFRNISSCGLADLVAWKAATSSERGELWLIDVKSGSGGAVRLTPEQRRVGVIPLCVDENDHCTFNPKLEQLNPPKLNTLLKSADLISLIEKNSHVFDYTARLGKQV